ncbi:MAG: acyltransferase [Candidatus Moraniibacteriota bacterium]|nr:MAG: acyltransferase [Candidatus Moranbacteria bacterium]
MERLYYLEGLRGIASLVVVVHHFILAFYPALFFGSSFSYHFQKDVEKFMSGSVLSLFYNGNFAVCLFFVLSGFVLSYKFFLEKKYESVRESIVKRYVRLMIPVVFSIFLVFFLMKLSLFFNSQVASISGSTWFGDFWSFEENFYDALYAGFIGSFFSDVFPYNIVLWTISFEFLGSLLVFAFLALFGTMKKRSIVYIVGMIFFFQTYYLAFILGMLLSDIATSQRGLLEKISRKKWMVGGLLFSGLFLGGFPSDYTATIGTFYENMHDPIFKNATALYHTIGAFLFIAALLCCKKAQNILSYKYFVFFGEISFSFYLLHFIVLGSLTSFIFLQLHLYFSYNISALFAFIISLGFLIIFSYWMYIYIDKKAIQFSKFLYVRFFK